MTVRAAQRFRRRFTKRRFVSRGESPELVEPVPGSDIGHSRLRRRSAERAPDAVEALGEDALLGAHAPHAVEGVAKASFAEPDDPAEQLERNGRRDVRPQIALGSPDDVLPRDQGGGALRTRAIGGERHGCYLRKLAEVTEENANIDM